MRNATQTTVSAFGVLMGLAGIEHGVGEILQGNRSPDAIIFPSWPSSPFFSNVAGEPALSLIPNLLLTGILAVIFSLSYLFWAVALSNRKPIGYIPVLLSIAMLLTGGGFFPPVLACLIGVVGVRFHARSGGLGARLPIGFRNFIARAWIWIFAFCWVAWLSLCPGLNILSCYFGIDNSTLTYTVILSAIGTLFLAFLFGIIHDNQRLSRPPSFPGNGSAHSD